MKEYKVSKDDNIHKIKYDFIPQLETDLGTMVTNINMVVPAPRELCDMISRAWDELRDSYLPVVVARLKAMSPAELDDRLRERGLTDIHLEIKLWIYERQYEEFRRECLELEKQNGEEGFETTFVTGNATKRFLCISRDLMRSLDFVQCTRAVCDFMEILCQVMA